MNDGLFSVASGFGVVDDTSDAVTAASVVAVEAPLLTTGAGSVAPDEVLRTSVLGVVSAVVVESRRTCSFVDVLSVVTVVSEPVLPGELNVERSPVSSASV